MSQSPSSAVSKHSNFNSFPCSLEMAFGADNHQLIDNFGGDNFSRPRHHYSNMHGSSPSPNFNMAEEGFSLIPPFTNNVQCLSPNICGTFSQVESCDLSTTSNCPDMDSFDYNSAIKSPEIIGHKRHIITLEPDSLQNPPDAKKCKVENSSNNNNNNNNNNTFENGANNNNNNNNRNNHRHEKKIKKLPESSKSKSLKPLKSSKSKPKLKKNSKITNTNKLYDNNGNNSSGDDNNDNNNDNYSDYSDDGFVDEDDKYECPFCREDVVEYNNASDNTKKKCQQRSKFDHQCDLTKFYLCVGKNHHKICQNMVNLKSHQ